MDLEVVPSRKRATVVMSFLGVFLQLISIVQGLVLVPFYLKFLGSAIFGLWLASGGVLVWLSFADLGINAIIAQRVSYYYGRKDNQAVIDYFNNGFLIIILASAFIFLIGYTISFLVPDLINADKHATLIRKAFQLAILTIILNVLNDGLRTFGISLIRPYFYVSNLIVWQIAGIVLILFFLTSGVGLISIPLGLVISGTCCFILNLIFTVYLMYKINVRVSLNKEILKEYIGFSPAFLSSRIGFSIVKNIEPTIITIVKSPEIATAYVITKRAADIIFNLLQQVRGATFSGFTHVFGEKDLDKASAIANNLSRVAIFGGLSLLSAYVVCNQTFVSLWVGIDNYLGFSISLLIAVGVFFRNLQMYLYYLLLGTNSIKTPSFLILVESILKIVLMFIFIKTIGIIGIPVGIIISSFFSIIIFYGMIVRTLALNFEVKKLLVILPYCLVLAVVFNFQNQITNLFNTWIRFGALAIISFLILTIPVLLNKSNRKLFKTITGTFRN